MGIALTTVQTINESAKKNRQNANASQNKMSCNSTYKPTNSCTTFAFAPTLKANASQNQKSHFLVNAQMTIFCFIILP